MKAKRRQRRCMIDPVAPRDDSQVYGGTTSSSGGQVPGLADAPAFTLWQREPSSIPVVIAVPHAGRSYPPELLTRMRHPGLRRPGLANWMDGCFRGNTPLPRLLRAVSLRGPGLANT